MASLTPYNSSPAAKEKGLLGKGAVVEEIEIGIEDFNPYSNLSGLFAVNGSASDSDSLDVFYRAIVSASAVSAPAYD